MIRVTAHTRRQNSRSCDACGRPIDPGDRYRLLVAVQSDVLDGDFVVIAAHDECVSHYPEWEVTTPAVLQQRAHRSLDYVRQRYCFSGRPGDRCVVKDGAREDDGQIIGGDGGYVLVRLDGHTHAHHWHPSDVTPMASGSDSCR